MRWIRTALVILGGCAGAMPVPCLDLTQIAQLVKDGQLEADPAHPFERIEVFPIPGEEGMYVAIVDFWAHWFGTFECFKVEDGQIAWSAGAGDPSEQSVLDVRGLRLRGFPRACVEVFGMTHMGNGHYYLFILEGRDLRCVLKTRAVDWHQDENLIRGGKLSVTYRDIDGDGVDDVEFTGIVEEYPDGDSDEKPIRSYPCRKVFYWKAGLRCYEEDRSQRRGFESYAKFGD